MQIARTHKYYIYPLGSLTGYRIRIKHGKPFNCVFAHMSQAIINRVRDKNALSGFSLVL